MSKIMNMVGIDMMGRDYLWQLVGEHYDFSIGYMGHGFEYVDSIVANWYSSGLINHPYPFHNDILKVFVEMGKFMMGSAAGKVDEMPMHEVEFEHSFYISKNEITNAEYCGSWIYDDHLSDG